MATSFESLRRASRRRQHRREALKHRGTHVPRHLVRNYRRRSFVFSTVGDISSVPRFLSSALMQALKFRECPAGGIFIARVET